jgi:hypothetical protein
MQQTVLTIYVKIGQFLIGIFRKGKTPKAESKAM